MAESIIYDTSKDNGSRCEHLQYAVSNYPYMYGKMSMNTQEKFISLQWWLYKMPAL